MLDQAREEIRAARRAWQRGQGLPVDPIEPEEAAQEDAAKQARQQIEDVMREAQARMDQAEAEEKRIRELAQPLYDRDVEIRKRLRSFERGSPEHDAILVELQANSAEITTQVWDEQKRVRQEAYAFRDEAVERARGYLYVDNPIQVEPNWWADFGEDQGGKIRKGFGEFGKMTNRSTMPGKIETHFAGPGRAFHRDGEIWLGNTSGARTTIHELGHALEFNDAEVHQKAVEFLERRTKGEAALWLGDNYDKDEMARKDKFLDPYMGKDYGDRATEIVSMGLEQMWINPARFAKADPEYFDFIFNLMRVL